MHPGRPQQKGEELQAALHAQCLNNKQPLQAQHMCDAAPLMISRCLGRLQQKALELKAAKAVLQKRCLTKERPFITDSVCERLQGSPELDVSCRSAAAEGSGAEGGQGGAAEALPGRETAAPTL